ncbi:bcl-2 homologous antagonist/killer-like [Biomphalaria glabrata]|uniref:Bcl-2 homologous antagonist/killer-like n=1 Tax=Biomphalaria glabrata TaxID=6526 RepID=A0A9U8E2I5_BIOGL|nr:bcl-2 homologous antagonist/killer-like [Biomphalaria glabrata]XP_013070173.2 bcl-2 homologous antagonist/killer-like [Biomphalaria glabrata]XP_013070175.2 bcl-2 homologous antagonist/killer-like [Biomphalaria glabrata]XP_013070176.2 bcl-2 homologous antagonist/killer-like [Biomphalaria glabrata]XP_055888808.1 bcl-2 homologous antagonist/killer-like [Biomphalaria glabrata]
MAWSQGQDNHSFLSGGLMTLREPQIRPDSEGNVSAQTEAVFRNYMYQSYENDLNREDAQDIPVVNELLHLSDPPSPEADIGRQLARFGDSINAKYADVFDSMISNLNLDSDNSENAYEDFAQIARRVLTTKINWGTILILLNFGYRIALTVLRSKTSQFLSFLSRIVSYICRFILSERIAKWIADHGGWRAALSYIPLMSSKPFWLVTALQAAAVIGIIFSHRL